MTSVVARYLQQTSQHLRNVPELYISLQSVLDTSMLMCDGNEFSVPLKVCDGSGHCLSQIIFFRHCISHDISEPGYVSVLR
jgi:hypothetical protein